MRVPTFLADQHVPFETVVHPPAYTSARRAQVLQMPGKQLAKSVLLAGPTGYVLAVLPATLHVNLDAVSNALGGPTRLAQRDEIPGVFQDCEWGSLVPFGKLYGVPSLIDESFEPESILVFEAQMHALAIRMKCRDFERLEKPRRLRFAR